MSSLNRFFLCNCVFICASNIYGEGPVFKKEEYKITDKRYYFYPKFSEKSIQAGNGYYYEEKDNIKDFLTNLDDNNRDESKTYYIDQSTVYECGWFKKVYYKIIRKKIYTLDLKNDINKLFEEKIKENYLTKFTYLLNDLQKCIYYGYKIGDKYEDLSEILEIEYDFNNLKFSLNFKKKIDKKYLKQEEPKPEVPKPEESKIVKKNITLKKFENGFLAPDAKEKFNSDIKIEEILKKDEIDKKIFKGLKDKFTDIKKDTDYELYSDEAGKIKLENINFDLINNGDVIYVKIKDFYLTEEQQKVINELNKIDLKEENKNILYIYQLIDKINSKVKIIEKYQYCKKFIDKYTNETNGWIKRYKDTIKELVDNCNTIIGVDDNSGIRGIDEKLEKDKLNTLKNDYKKNFEKLTGNYKDKDISKYTELSTVVNNYNTAINDLDSRIKSFEEYKGYETTVTEDVNVLVTNINNKKVDEIKKIDDFEKFQSEQESNFSSKTENLGDRYKKYETKFKTFVSNLKLAFNEAINNKKSEFDRNSLKNAKSKEIFDEITKYLNDYQKAYSSINDIDDKKLENTEKAIKKEIRSNIDNILTDKLKSIVDNKKEIEDEIKDKFTDTEIDKKAKSIIGIINKKKDDLKIKFTLIKKNTEKLKDEYSTKFNKIINNYKSGVCKNVKFSELRSEISEISENKDIKLYTNNYEVNNYNQNITKDSIIYVEFQDSYLVKIETPKHIYEENNDPNREKHTDEENNDHNNENNNNNNQENNVDKSDTNGNTTTKKGCSNSGKEGTNKSKGGTNSNKSKKSCCPGK